VDGVDGVDGIDGIAPDVGADFSERLTDQGSANKAASAVS
jgi:hypothetical protein